jgi:hypothetical protein
MSDIPIQCPRCGNEFKLTESLAQPLIEKMQQDFRQQLAQKDQQAAQQLEAVRAKFQQQEEVLRAQREKLDADRAALEEKAAELAEQQRRKIAEEEARKARLAAAGELESKTRQLREYEIIMAANNAKLAEAQKAQAELLRKERQLDDARREMELTVEKRVTAALGQEREKAQKEAEEKLKLQLAERDEQLKSMQKKIDELKQKAEQGSQQLQGEVQELELESRLKECFPHDLIEPVPKGEFGGDIIQVVHNPQGQRCGAILWESKRTKTWSDGWLAKLRGDMRTAKAECSILMSRTLPKDVETFALIDDVWVTGMLCALPLAAALRNALIEIQSTRLAGEGQQTKMGMVYQYLTGPEFRQRVEAMVEAFKAMQQDLQDEKKAMQKIWARREKQLDMASGAIAGMYGDLQGIAGRQLKEIEGLDLRSLGAGE